MKDKKISKELLEIFKKDQKMRKTNSYNVEIDKENQGKLKNIIQQIGWPEKEKVGLKGETTAWLIAQHSDNDVKFQEKCLRILKTLPSNKSRKQYIAYLTDRIFVNKKRKQIYGTQFYKNKDNKLVPRPIKDIKNLDKRRKANELESFEKYKKEMKKLK
jgi:hypothetical protein